jgi:hypothetical protein
MVTQPDTATQAAYLLPIVVIALMAPVAMALRRAWEPVTPATRCLALEIAAQADGVHESHFVGREWLLEAAVAKGVLSPAGGAWSYEAESWYAITARGLKLGRATPAEPSR